MRKRSGSDDLRDPRVVVKLTRTDGSGDHDKHDLLKPERRTKNRPRKTEPSKKRQHKRGISSRSLASHDTRGKDKSETGSTDSSDELGESSGTSTSSTEDETTVIDTNLVTAREISHAIVSFCFEKTANTRKFMEENPDEPQPKDFRLYPGKVT